MRIPTRRLDQPQHLRRDLAVLRDPISQILQGFRLNLQSPDPRRLLPSASPLPLCHRSTLVESELGSQCFD
jgi:hypothetical protein